MEPELPAPSQVNLLWTGGWDSTFQLLRVLLINRYPVQPHYVLDEGTAAQAEIHAMARIRERLASDHPHTRALLRPTRVLRVADLPQADALPAGPDAISAFPPRFTAQSFARLAQWCRQRGVVDMELCIHHGDEIHGSLDRLVSEGVSRGGYRTWRMDPRHAGTRAGQLFGHFSFPLFDRSKLQMAGIARRRGWNPIMQLTWFCQQPTRDLQPCGRCAACLRTMREGLGWRIPLENRMTSALYRTLLRPLSTAAAVVGK